MNGTSTKPYLFQIFSAKKSLCRAAATATIHSFGQTPRQLFRSAHPARKAINSKPYELGFLPSFHLIQSSFLIQSVVPVLEISGEVSSIIAVGQVPSRCVACRPQTLFIPGEGAHQLMYGFSDATVRIKIDSVITIIECLDAENIRAACFAGSNLLIVASTTSTVNVWKVSIQANEAHLQHVQTLRGHRSKLTCIQASRLWSIIVSGAEVYVSGLDVGLAC